MINMQDFIDFIARVSSQEKIEVDELLLLNSNARRMSYGV